jgi:hypothetical protein
MSANPSRSLTGKWLLALVLAIGFGGVWMTLAGWLASTVLVTQSGVYQSLVYSAQGEPFIQTYDPRNYLNRSYRGLDGQPRQLDDHAWLPGTTAAGIPQPAWAAPADGWQGRIVPLSDGTSPATFWYFMQDATEHGSAYLVGYDSVSRRQVGYLDATGFHADAPRQAFHAPNHSSTSALLSIASSQGIYGYADIREPTYYNQPGNTVFPGWRVYVIDGDRLLEVDLRQRNKPPRELLKHEGLLSVQISGGYQPGATPVDQWQQNNPQATPQQSQALIVSSPREIIVYAPAEGEPQVYPRPAELVGKAVNVYRPVDGGLIMEYTNYTSDPETPPVSVYTYDAEGQLAETRQVSLSRGTPTSSGVAAAGMTLAAPVPALAVFFIAVPLPLNRMYYDDSLSYGAALQKSVEEMGVYPAIAIALSIALAWACYRRQRRYGERVVVPWVVLILLLGLPGYVGYRWHRRWPLRRTCPTCNMPSPQNRSECLDCGADWPRPDAKGIEVYA